LLIVSDTSPILNLVAVGRLELLRDLYGSIVIPPAVSAELYANGIFLTADWVEVIEPGNRAAVDGLRAELDAGESEAIVLAQQLKASLLLMDERLGRRAAIQLGLDVTGLLGILAEGKKRGLINLCAPLLDSMIARAGFWIGERLRSDYLKALGELDE
jgi:predicted nucleic acid-binding protein